MSRLVRKSRPFVQSVFHSHGKYLTPFFSQRLYSATNNDQVIFTLQDLTKVVHVVGKPPRVLFENVSLNIKAGTKIGLIGANGVGKSTLMKIFSKFDADGFDGTAYPAKNVTVGYLEQEPHLDASKNVFENVTCDHHEKLALLTELDRISAAFEDPEADFDQLASEQEQLMAKIEENNVWNLSRKAEIAMSCLNCPPGDSPVDFLSGGEKRRIALARLLLLNAQMLVLDEPTNHLDAQSVAWLEMYLKHFKGAVIAVTHDRYFLDNVATVIWELDNGKLYTHKGNYSSWLEGKAERTRLEKKRNEGLYRRMKKELKSIQEAKSNIGKIVSKSKESSYDELVQKYEKATVKDRIASGKLIIPHGPRLGSVVMSASKISKSFDGKPLFTDLSFDISAGDILGIVGRNGSGKTTLFRILTGELKPDSGTVTIGSTVRMGYADQSRSFSSEENTLLQEISEGMPTLTFNSEVINVRVYIAQFNFRNESQEKQIKNLSGGERNRVHLAKLLRNNYNLFMFDEPTNDLDIDTLRSLEEGLREFPGSSIIISHDRWFLDRLCTRVLVFEDDGKVVFYSGNYSQYLKSKGLSTGYKDQEASAIAAVNL